MTASVNPGTGECPSTGDVVRRLRAAGCVFAEDEAALLVEAAAGESSVLARLVAAREAGEPLEQLLGWVAFCGRRIVVGPGVFVPRVRTELLAEQALALLADGAVVVELCCGVAAVAAVLQASGRVGELYVADVDPVAIGYARRNVAEPGVGPGRRSLRSVAEWASGSDRRDRRERPVRADGGDRPDAARGS